MKSILLKIALGLLAIVLLLVLAFMASAPYAKWRENLETVVQPMTQGDVRLTNVRLSDYWTVSEQKVTEDQLYNVDIQHGYIVGIYSVDASPRIESTTKVVDAQGRWLAPGLIDSHVHIFDQSELYGYLVHGVTTVRNMMGFPLHLRWRDSIEQNRLNGPTIVTASPTINFGQGDGGPFHKYVSSASEVDYLVRQYQQQGYDFIKFYEGLEEDMFYQLAATARELDMPFAGHPVHQVDIASLLAKKPTSIEHVEALFNGPLAYNLDIEQGSEVLDALALYQVPVVTTLTSYENIYLASEHRSEFMTQDRLNRINPFIRWIGESGLAPVTNEEHRKWIVDKQHALRALFTAMQERGVPMVLGTDTGPALTVAGRSVHDEMQILSELGISREHIFSMATTGGAKLLGREGIAGKVAIAEQANLVLLDGNPLNDLHNLREPWAVLVQGRVYGPDALEKMQRLSQEHQSIYTTLGYFVEHYLAL